MIGDYEPDDAYDPTAPPDPEQVARKLAEYTGEDWEHLTAGTRLRRLEAVRLLLEWLRRSGALR
jgi:hypothetical protein